MKNNYLNDSEKDINIKSYSFNKYISEKQDETTLMEEYNLFLSPDQDIFSLIPKAYFESTNMDCPILSRFLNIFKKELVKYCTKSSVNNVFPKLRIRQDEEEAFMLEWNYIHYRIYFAFEKKIEDSNYGIVCDNRENGEYFSKSGLLKEKNFEKIINELIDFVMRNT